MKQLLIFIVIALLHLPVESQNLLANSSFEDENVCTEFNERCSPEGWITSYKGVPLFHNSYALGKPFDGNRFVQLVAGTSKQEEARTFITTRLLCGLRKGNRYFVELYVRSSFQNLDSIGALFSDTDFLYEKRSFKEIEPSVWIKNDTAATGLWVKHSSIYTATGNEVFFTIGVFKKQEFKVRGFDTKDEELMVFIDQVSLVPLQPNEKVCSTADSLKHLIYRQDERHSRLEKKKIVFSNNPPPTLRPQPTSIVLIDTLVASDIFFKSASSRLEKGSNLKLDSFVTLIQGKAIDSIVVVGHADSIGNYNYNNKLSADRAATVAQYFGSRLTITVEKIIIYNHAFLKPVASNSTASGRERNRRVEIFVYRHEQGEK